MSGARRFTFRLALALGMTVREMLSRMSALELTEWQRYYDVEPFGEERSDLRAAIVARVIAQSNGARAAKLEDFIPRFERREARPQTAADQMAVFRALAARGKIVKE